MRSIFIVLSILVAGCSDGRTTVSMVGDSIVCCYTHSFRHQLAKSRPDMKFVGSRPDFWGYWHDGVGGATTDDTLARIHKVPASKIAFVLVGTNDVGQGKSPAYIVENIHRISETLTKNHDVVYVLTLLDRKEETLNRSIADVNQLLLSASWPSGVHLIDTDKMDWRPLLADSVHPGPDGYRQLVGFIASSTPTLNRADLSPTPPDVPRI